MTDSNPKEFWENRYAGSKRVWSGRVNATLSSLVEDLPEGRALDLGCGEGGDVLWLARRGWEAVGVDISETAVTRARTHAGLEDLGRGSAEFFVGDLPAGMPAGPFDLITASFLQSPVALDRREILAAAADRVSIDGHLAVVSHASAPPWSKHQHGPDEMPTLEGDLESLQPNIAWEVEVGELRQRSAVGPDGQVVTLEDLVILARRLY